MVPAATMATTQTTITNSSNQQHVALGWVRHDEALTKMAAACWTRDRFTDVTIYCEDRVLQAHRLVLASMSPLLANLLAEAAELGIETALMLPEVKAEDMRLLLQFIYQGEVVLPPRRTAALLDLAAQLCVAGVRGYGGGGQSTPPGTESPVPELDSSIDRNESEASENENNNSTTALDHNSSSNKRIIVDDDDEDPVECDESNDRPMNLASKPEVRVNGSTTNSCPNRPKPCNSSPPELNAFHSTTSRTPSAALDALSYYQHPALRGCHPFSLELAAVNRRGTQQTQQQVYHHSNKNHQIRTSNNNNNSDSAAENSDVEVTMDVTSGDGASSSDPSGEDREIDLSLGKSSNNFQRSSSEEKMTPSPVDQDSLGSSNESGEHIKGRGFYGLHPSSGSAAVSSLSHLADKMFLMPGSAGSDPRRTYLETVLQESLVQQSYTIVLPSHLTGNPAVDHHHHADRMTPQTSLEAAATKAWNLAAAGKTSSAAAAVAELKCLQGLFASRESANSYASRTAALQCGGIGEEDEDDDDDDSDLPTNLSTSKNNNCGSNSSSSSKRNGKEGYSCGVCRKMFTSSSNLAVHSMIHSGTKPFKCDLCSWSFRQKAHLQKHMRHIHKIIVAK